MRQSVLTFGYDIETTGLNPFENEIITIQFRRGATNHLFKAWESNENEIIFQFLESWKTIPRSIRGGGDFFVAFNVKFDTTFLFVRATKHKMHERLGWNERLLWENVVHGPSFIDMYQLLGDQLMNFAKWRRCLVGTFGRYKNAQIPIFYREKKFDIIEEYINDELLSLENVYSAVMREPFYEQLLKLREEARQADLGPNRVE